MYVYMHVYMCMGHVFVYELFHNMYVPLHLHIFSVSGFEFTSESGLFDLFGVALYHGWLVDPQDKETYEVVSQYSYNQLAEMVINNNHSSDVEKLKNGECMCV